MQELHSSSYASPYCMRGRSTFLLLLSPSNLQISYPMFVKKYFASLQVFLAVLRQSLLYVFNSPCIFFLSHLVSSRLLVHVSYAASHSPGWIKRLLSLCHVNEGFFFHHSCYISSHISISKVRTYKTRKDNGGPGRRKIAVLDLYTRDNRLIDDIWAHTCTNGDHL